MVLKINKQSVISSILVIPNRACLMLWSKNYVNYINIRGS